MATVKCYEVQIHKNGKTETLKEEFTFFFDKEIDAEDIKSLFYKLDKQTGYLVKNFSCLYS